MPRTQFTDLDKKSYHDFIRHTLAQINQEVQAVTTPASVQSWYADLSYEMMQHCEALKKDLLSHKLLLEKIFNCINDFCRSCSDTKLRVILSTLITHTHLLILSFS